MNKELIQVHCKKETFVVCDSCDEDMFSTYLYYRIANPKNDFEKCCRYLECCKDKVGVVVDWEELDLKPYTRILR